MAKRVFLIVLDSFGVGAEPDAPLFGDVGTNTLGAIAGHPNFRGDNLARLGMFNLDGVTCGTPAAAPIGSYARLREASAGKDTTIGHWEIAGVESEKALPVYPDGFFHGGMSKAYLYQNGGDWTWFGGRMIQQLVVNGMVEEAYAEIHPMIERVIQNDGFYEWYGKGGVPSGSGNFKGSAGVLSKAIELLRDWAEKNKS